MPFQGSLSTDLVTEKNKVTSTSPWIWLVEADVDGSNAVRLAAYDAQVTFESVVWYPFPIQISPPKTSGGAAVSGFDITISNAGRMAMAQLQAGNIVGRQLRLIAVHSDHLASGAKALEFLVLVQSATATEDSVTFNVGVTNPMTLPFPGERVQRTRCRFLKEYGSGRCGYDKSLSNAISGTNSDFDPTTCDGTLGQEASGNGCKAHGANEAAHGVAQIHPKRFGGFPGIPKGTLLSR